MIRYSFLLFIGWIVISAWFCKPVSISGSQKLLALGELPNNINESSGLVFADDSSLFTNNDSGNPPDLFQISKTNGHLINTFRIPGVKNRDWEELASDSSFIYVGDFGNNGGNRKDLVIYKINKKVLLSDSAEEPESIHFHYPEQTQFNSSNRHNFDCEAMIAYGDSLYLFTKNRGDLATDVYRLPKRPGDFPAVHMNHFNTGGLVTGADIFPGATNKLALICYKSSGMQLESFAWWFTDFHQADFFGSNKNRIPISKNLQSEAILISSDTTAYITHEEESGGRAKLYRIILHVEK